MRPERMVLTPPEGQEGCGVDQAERRAGPVARVGRVAE